MKPIGFFGYVPSCPNPDIIRRNTHLLIHGNNSSRLKHCICSQSPYFITPVYFGLHVMLSVCMWSEQWQPGLLLSIRVRIWYMFQPLVQRWKQTRLRVKVQTIAEGRRNSSEVDALHLYQLLGNQPVSQSPFITVTPFNFVLYTDYMIVLKALSLFIAGCPEQRCLKHVTALYGSTT